MDEQCHDYDYDNMIRISCMMDGLICIPSAKVVKIAFWLLKSYDFTSQNMFYVLNRLKKSKIDEIGLKSGKIDKIG